MKLPFGRKPLKKWIPQRLAGSEDQSHAPRAPTNQGTQGHYNTQGVVRRYLKKSVSSCMEHFVYTLWLLFSCLYAYMICICMLWFYVWILLVSHQDSSPFKLLMTHTVSCSSIQRKSIHELRRMCLIWVQHRTSGYSSCQQFPCKIQTCISQTLNSSKRRTFSKEQPHNFCNKNIQAGGTMQTGCCFLVKIQ